MMNPGFPSRAPIPGRREDLAMNVTQVGDSAVIAVVNDDGLWFYWQAIGTAPWHPELVGPGGA